jgi:hypothetical protein
MAYNRTRPVYIPYADRDLRRNSAMKLFARVSNDWERIHSSSDVPGLPVPSASIEELESDYMRHGYCLVKDALSPAQLAAARDRLLDQAAAEVAAELAILPKAVIQ